MKNYVFAGIILGSFFPLVALAALGTDLRYGSAGQDVVALQEFLSQQNVYSGPISGNFYSLTLASVKAFQTAEGITPASGYVGPVTRGVINQILAGQDAGSEDNATVRKPVVDLSLQPSNAAPGAGSASAASDKAALIKILLAKLADLNARITAIQQTQQQVASSSQATALNTQQIAQNTTPSSAQSNNGTSNSTPTLTLFLGQTSVSTNSAYLTWTTNIPAVSKVFISPVGSSAAPRVISSAAGYSTQGLATINDLLPNTQYSYTIEAITNSISARHTGSIFTEAKTTPIVLFQAETATLWPGDIIKLSWETKAPTTCTLSDGSTTKDISAEEKTATFTAPQIADGSVKTITYTLRCDGFEKTVAIAVRGDFITWGQVSGMPEHVVSGVPVTLEFTFTVNKQGLILQNIVSAASSMKMIRTGGVTDERELTKVRANHYYYGMIDLFISNASYDSGGFGFTLGDIVKITATFNHVCTGPTVGCSNDSFSIAPSFSLTSYANPTIHSEKRLLATIWQQ